MNINDGALSFDALINDSMFQRQIDEMERRIIGLSGTTVQETNKMDNSFSKLGVAMGGYFSVSMLRTFADEIINVRKETEMLEKSFEVLLGNKSKADSMISDLKDLALISPLSVNDVSKAAQLLLSFNIEAEKVIPTLTQLGDISMGDSQRFQSLALAFAQMSSTGKLMGQDLLQMINAGFNPLSIMAEKTGKSIGQLKDEMAEGAISSEMVADAFRMATEEGGKFYGMMEKQAEGIAGKQAELASVINEIYNKLGEESQDFITGAYDITISLIKNYEKLGEIILGLIATYGTYKSAVIAVSVVENLRYQATLAQMAGFTKMQAITEVLRGKIASLNATMLANPAVAITAGIIALGYATYKLATYQTEAEKAQSRLNDAMKEAEKNSLSETRELAKLKGELSALEKGTDEYNSVKNKIISNYGQYYNGLEQEINKVGLLETTYNKLTQAIQKSFGARQYDSFIKSEQENLDNVMSKNLGKIQDRLYKDLGDEEGAKVYTQIRKALIDRTNLSSDIIDVLDKVQDKGTLIADSRLDMYIRNIQEAQNITDEMDKKARVQFGIEDKNPNSEDDVNKETSKFKTFSEQIGDAKQKVSDLKKELSNLKKGVKPEDIKEGGQFDFAKGIEDKTKALKDAENKLNYLLFGKSTSEVSKDNKNAEKRAQLNEKKIEADQWLLNKQKELSNEQIKAELESEQKTLDLQKDSYDKRIKQNELNYRKELQSIKDFEANKEKAQQEAAKKIYTSEHGGNDKGFDFSKFDMSKLPKGLRPEDIKEQVTRLATEVQAAWENADMLAYEEMTKEFMSFQQQKADVTKTYQDLITQYESMGLSNRVALIKKERDQTLGELSAMEIQTSDLWKNLFQNMDNLSEKTIKDIIAKLRELVKNIEDIDIKNALTKQLDDAEQSLGNKNPFSAFKKGIEDYKNASDEASKNKAMKNIGESAKSMSAIVTESLGSVVKGLKDLGMMDEDTEKILEDVMNLVSSLGDAGEGIARLSAGDITAAPQAIAGVVGTITSVFSLFDSKSRDIEKKIKAHKKQLIELGRVYKDIEYQVNNAVGEDYYSEQFKAIENLKKQQKEVEGLLYQENRKKKKNRDDDAINGYKDQLAEIPRQIQDIEREITETLVQTSFKDLSNQLADVLVSAFEAGEDAAKDFDKTFNKVIANAVRNSLKLKVLDKPINEFTEALSEYMLDNNYSANGFNFEKWRNILKEAGESFTSGLQEFEKYFDLGETDRQGATGGFAQASQDSINELNGLMYATRQMIGDIRNDNREDLLIQRSIVGYLITIAENTGHLKAVQQYLHNIDTYGIKMKP